MNKRMNQKKEHTKMTEREGDRERTLKSWSIFFFEIQLHFIERHAVD